MKFARIFVAAALGFAAVVATSAPSLAASKTTTVHSNGECTTKTVKVREHGVMRTRTVRRCDSGSPSVAIHTPVLGANIVVGPPTRTCVTKTVVEHGYRRSRKVCN